LRQSFLGQIALNERGARVLLSQAGYKLFSDYPAADSDALGLRLTVAFCEPFGLLKQHPLGLRLRTLFDLGLDFFNQGYCF
jgi:hypothetical protein